MSRDGAIAGSVVERAPGLIATPCAAVIGITLLFDRIFDVFLGTGASAETVVQRLGRVAAGRSRSSQSDTADTQRVTPPTPSHKSVIDGEGRLYKPDYLAHASGVNTVGAIRVQHRER